MKGLKKVALASAIAAVSAGAQAELKALDDSAMGELTGQAGLTIDLETQLSIGEFTYVDAGAVIFRDIYRGGKDDASGNRTMLDNIRLTLDVAGAGETFNYGLSKVRSLAYFMSQVPGQTDAALYGQAALGTETYNSQTYNIDGQKAAGDGDLILHFSFNDAWAAGNGFFAYANSAGKADLNDTANATGLADLTWANAREMAKQSVDFQFEIGQIALADSGYGANLYDAATGTYAGYENGRLGQETIQKTDHATGLDTDANGANTTTLISDLKISGYLGPMDIIIENNGNGFGNGAGVGAADSKIHWDSFVKVTDLDLYIDIAGVQLTDIRIHNERGDLTGLNDAYDNSGNLIVDASGNAVKTTTFGFAHSKREIYAVKDAVLDLTKASYVTDGIAINTQFKGDIDVGALSFGNSGDSIGSLYFTDIESTTNWTISGR